MFCFLRSNRQDTRRTEPAHTAEQRLWASGRLSSMTVITPVLTWKTEKRAFEFKDVSSFLPFFRGFWKQRHT